MDLNLNLLIRVQMLLWYICLQMFWNNNKLTSSWFVSYMYVLDNIYLSIKV